MSHVVRVIAPTGRDADMITGVLQRHNVQARPATFAALFAKQPDIEAFGPLLITEEALSPAAIEQLALFLAAQPSWSDLPLLILTGSGRETRQSSLLNLERLSLGTPVLLERPIRAETLLSSVKAALRARKRQYEVRDAVAELTAERELLNAMLDNLPVGVVLARASGEIVRGNRRLEEIMRHPLRRSKDTDAQSEWIAFHPDGTRVKGPEYPLARAMQAGHALPAEEYLFERGDGTQAWISLAAAPILNTLGEVTGGVVSVTDIDQQKRSEAALIQNEKLAAVGRLAASISHEINNPLEAVTNLLYLVRHHEALPEEVRPYLATADQELARVSQMVSHTLRFHRQSTKPRAISTGQLLEPTLGLYAGRLLNSNITLELRDRSTTLVTCFEGEIRQVLNNLVGNAADAMKTGGRLLVRTADVGPARTADVGPTHPGGPGVRITVADTGHGMPAAVLQHIYDAFYTTKGINGTGLGMWISRGIVDKHFGTLRVRSSDTPGRSGTVFSLFLPTHPPL